MKLWITRLSGDLITSAHYQSNIKKNNGSSSVGSSSNNNIDGNNQDIYRQIKQMETIRYVINHSRTLSLSLYDHQLIYCKFQGTSFYYRAKYNLLFIAGQQSKEYLDLSVDSIDNIILRTIKIYEAACDNIRINYNIPKFISNYQKSCLQQINADVIKLIKAQAQKSGIRLKQQNEEGEVKQQQIQKAMNKRKEGIDKIEVKLRKLERLPSLFEKNTLGSVNNYKLKLCFVTFLGAAILFTCIFLIFFSPNNERLIL